MTKSSYNKEFLDEVLKKDNAVLTGVYNTFNRDMKPKFKCSCDKEEDNRTFRDIFKKGAYCHDCIYKMASEKRNKTVKETHGVECISQIESVKAKRVSTNMERRGTTCPFASSEIRNKSKITTLERYGVEHPLQNKEILAKVMATRKERCGFEHSLQNPEIMEKQQKNSFSFKDFVMPSGNVRKVQGFEPFALNILVKDYLEEQIKTDRNTVPRICYKDNENHKYHYPDIWIPHENRLIEVKSTQTYKWHKQEVLLKKKACEEQGFQYEIWCFDVKGNRVEISA